ncbi:Endothelin-converting enzyme [Daphnia magna]|nr:Endothelin-converting enzyme [Daphnia magna]
MKCVSNQFSNAFRTEYSINGTSIVLKVDGELTLNENVADLGAIKAIVATQTRMARERGPAPNLPGLNYTHEQIMLINAAQAYCALITPQAYALILGMDEHAPPHDRVNGFMMNLPDYGRIFNCPAGTRLNPKSKCSVW